MGASYLLDSAKYLEIVSFRHPRFQREAYPTRRSDGRKFEVPVDSQRWETRSALASRCDRPSTTACHVVSGPAIVSGGCNENHGTYKGCENCMRYQHPEIEIVRTALNLGTGSITVTKPCSHTPCAGSFVATIQFLGHTGWNGGKRGPSTGVRVSKKRSRSPLALSPKKVKLGLSQLEFQDLCRGRLLKNDLRVFEVTGRLLHEKRAGGLYGAAGRHHRQEGIEEPQAAPGSRLSGDPGRLSGLIERTIDVSDSFHEAGEVDFVDYSGSKWMLPLCSQKKTGESPFLPTGLSSPVRVAPWICWLIERQESSSFARLQRM